MSDQPFWPSLGAPASAAELDAVRMSRDPGDAAFGADWFPRSLATGTSALGSYWRAAEREIRGGGFFMTGLPALDDAYLSADEANARFGIADALSFDKPVAAAYAADLFEIKQAELYRADAQMRSSQTRDGWGQVRLFGSAFAAGALTDPAGLALGFVPVFGPSARLRSALPGLAAMETSAQLGTRLAGRAGFGAIEGAGSAALFEAVAAPAFMGIERRDYDFTDSLLNLAIGAGFGGAAGALLRPRGDAPAIDPPEVATLTPAAREAAHEAAVRALAEGEPVDVGPAIAEAEAREAADLAARPQIAARPLAEATVYAPDGTSAPVRYAIVDVDDLVTSNTDALTVNPDYPQALQPRDRTRAASEVQIEKFGEPFQPERWGETPGGDTGAPVIGPDGVVESGNGRVIWLRRAYRADDPRAAQMRAWLEAQGYDVEGVQRPVLVRIVQGERSIRDRAQFAAAMNRPAAAAMSVTEQAMADARAIDAALDLHSGGASGAAANARFARAAIAGMTSEAERGALVDAQGRLSQDGERRLDAALMARAYDDADLIAARFETRDEDIRTLGGALQDAAPAMAQTAAAIDAGRVDAAFDLRPALKAAAALLRQAKRDGRSVKSLVDELTAQLDMFGGGPSARTLDVLALIVDDAGKLRSRDKITAALNAYARLALESEQPALMRDAEVTTDAAIGAAAQAQGRGGQSSEPGARGLRRGDDGGADRGGGGSQPEAAAAARGAESRAAVEGALADQLAATGRLSPGDAKTSATLLARAYETFGRYYGMTAEEMFAARPVRIEAAAPDAGGEGRIAGDEALVLADAHLTDFQESGDYDALVEAGAYAAIAERRGADPGDLADELAGLVDDPAAFEAEVAARVAELDPETIEAAAPDVAALLTEEAPPPPPRDMAELTRLARRYLGRDDAAGRFWAVVDEARAALAALPEAERARALKRLQRQVEDEQLEPEILAALRGDDEIDGLTPRRFAQDPRREFPLTDTQDPDTFAELADEYLPEFRAYWTTFRKRLAEFEAATNGRFTSNAEVREAFEAVERALAAFEDASELKFFGSEYPDELTSAQVREVYLAPILQAATQLPPDAAPEVIALIDLVRELDLELAAWATDPVRQAPVVADLFNAVDEATAAVASGGFDAALPPALNEALYALNMVAQTDGGSYALSANLAELRRNLDEGSEALYRGLRKVRDEVNALANAENRPVGKPYHYVELVAEFQDMLRAFDQGLRQLSRPDDLLFQSAAPERATPPAVREADDWGRALQAAAACAAGVMAPTAAAAAGLGEMAVGMGLGLGVGAPSVGVALWLDQADERKAAYDAFAAQRAEEARVAAEQRQAQAERRRLAKLKDEDFVAYLGEIPPEQMLDEVADRVGIPARYLADMIQKESAGDPNAQAATSSAAGLTQFIDATWVRTMRRYGPAHGLTIDPATPEGLALKFDPRWAKLMGAEYSLENARNLKGALGRDPTQGEVYLAHFMGDGAAIKLIRAAQRGESNAARLFPEAAAANRNVFYWPADGRPRSAKEVIARQTQGFSDARFPVLTPVPDAPDPEDAPL
jgi:hypothetical protein